jgi:ribosomal protein S18 acetylase RimI-like enzyme
MSGEESKSPIIIREAMLTDLNDIYEMQKLLGDHELPYDEVIDIDSVKSGKGWGYIGYVDMKAKIESEENYVLVAETVEAGKKKCVGVCYGQIKMDEVWSVNETYGYVGCVYIMEAYRGNRGDGIWPRMVDKLTSWFKSHHIKQMRLDCYTENVGAVRAYEKNGFEKLQYIMYKNIF